MHTVLALRPVAPAAASLVLLVLSTGALLAAAGCQERVINIQVGGEAAPAPGKTGTVGRSGGSLVVDDPASPIYGAEIVVPPGAVSGNTEVSLQPAPGVTPPFGLPAVAALVQIRFTPDLGL